MANKLFRTIRKRRGVVLLMGLLFMAAITASTTGVALVVNSSLQQSHNVDDYILASLAADSGLERGLATMYETRKDYSKYYWQALYCSDSSQQNCIYPGTPPSTFANNAIVTVRSSETLEPVAKSALADGESINFDIFPTGAYPAQFISVAATCQATGTCDRLLEVSWTAFATTNSSTYSNREILSNTRYQNSSVCLDLRNVRSETDDAPGAFNGSTPAFHVKVTARRGTVNDVAIRAYMDATCATQVPIISRIKLDSIGQANATGSAVRAEKQVNALWQPVGSSAFGYVLFSEESIIP